MIKPREIQLTVLSCGDCPLRQVVTEQGSSLLVCSHPASPSGYGSVITTPPDQFPDWCPATEVDDVAE